jgi:uncharacterized membrane protein
VIRKSPSGTWSLKEARDPNAGMGTLVGSMAGVLIGLIGGPIGAMIGLSTGALIGFIGDVRKADVSSDFVQQSAEAMSAGSYAILADVTETWEAPLDIEMEGSGGRLVREAQFMFEAEKAEREAEARRAELDRLKAELKGAADDRRAKLEKQFAKASDDLKAAAARLDAQAQKVITRAEQRLDAIVGQIADAQAEHRAALERRRSSMRVDLDARKSKMRQALDLARQALGPNPQETHIAA